MIYVVTGFPRSGTSYLIRCLQNGGCRVVRHRRHKRLEIAHTYKLRNFNKIIKAVNFRSYNPRVNYAIKVFVKHMPLMEHHKDVHPILVVRDYKSLLASVKKRDILNPWVRMGPKHLEDIYDIYYRWLKKKYPRTEKVIFPEFREWAAKTKVPVKIIPYVRRRDG